MASFAFLFVLFLGTGVSATPLQLPPQLLDHPDHFPGNIRPLINERLPRHVIPLHYDVKLRPHLHLPLDDPDQFTTPGSVSIRLRCLEATGSITLHSDDIDIDHATVNVTAVGTGANIPVTGYTANTTLTQYTVQLGTPLTPGSEYDLELRFMGKVGDRLFGLYRSSYVDGVGNVRWLATTQFQRLGARMAFPCFDEPDFKATFNISLGRVQGYHTLCNSPLLETVPIPEIENWMWDVYMTTVTMPTYLLAIIVSDFVSIDAPAGISDHDVKIWGPDTLTNERTAEFSARATAQTLSFFETYTNETFQFPKVDSAAIPDFWAGAMENWALITYRPQYLLWFEGESTQREQWSEQAVIAHELAHQWFGNLVTCKWWNEMWLNEGFASYMEVIATEGTLPGFGAGERFPIEKLQPALAFDVGPNTRPVNNNNTEENIEQPGRIIYDKGASMLQMMSAFLTKETFVGGIRSYLKNNAYGNVVQDQLFEELQIQAQIDGTAAPYTVKEIMDTWTFKVGYPLVKLSLVNNNTVQITQTPYDTTQNYTELWYVPVAYATQQNPDFSQLQPTVWVNNGAFQVEHTVQTDQWIILNTDARSFYRSIYDRHFFTKILQQLESNHAVISPSSRSQLIDDHFATGFAGKTLIEDALELTQYLHKEAHNTVWTTVFNNLRLTYRLLRDSRGYRDFSEYLLYKITPVLDQMGWEHNAADDPVTIVLRTQLVDWACALGSLRCRALAVSYFSALAENGTGIPADLHPMIYCQAVNTAHNVELPNSFDVVAYMFDEYVKAARPERKNAFVNALACEDPWYLPSLLELITAPNTTLSTAHITQVFQRAVDNPSSRQAVLDYLNANLSSILQRLGESAIGNIVAAMANYSSEPAMMTEISAFIDTALSQITNETVRNSLLNSRTQMIVNSLWVTSWGQRILDWIGK